MQRIRNLVKRMKGRKEEDDEKDGKEEDEKDKENAETDKGEEPEQEASGEEAPDIFGADEPLGRKGEGERDLKCFRMQFKGMEYSSHVLNAQMLKKLRLKLFDSLVPSSTRWDLIYSTDIHGYSLKTLMTEAKGRSRGCFILVLAEEKSTGAEHERVFGSMFNAHLEYKPIPYGDTHTCLFRFRTPKSQDSEAVNTILDVYHSQDKNRFFIMTKSDYLAFGCGDAKFGLFLDKGMLRGESHPVSTFDNERLSHREKFRIKRLELWNVKA